MWGTQGGFLFPLRLSLFLVNENHRVPKCDVIKNEICEIMGFVKLF